jgi:hypothetical protein
MASDVLKTIIEVLKQTKENNELSLTNSVISKLLKQIGVVHTDENSVIIDRTQRIDLAKIAVQKGASIGEIVEFLTWKDFEGFVASILIANNYQCIESFRRRGNSLVRGMEIDVIGVKGSIIIAIDAKMWGIRIGKAAALKTAAEKQKKRTQELSEELEKLSLKISDLRAREYQIFPVLVTWLVEEVEIHEGVPVVPIFKLNSFILDLDQYEDIMVSYSGHHYSLLD